MFAQDEFYCFVLLTCAVCVCNSHVEECILSVPKKSSDTYTPIFNLFNGDCVWLYWAMNSLLVIIVLCLSVDQCLIAMVDGKSQNILEDKLEFENCQKKNRDSVELFKISFLDS